MSTVAVVVPIYQARPSEIEQFSLRHSLAQLKPGRTVLFKPIVQALQAEPINVYGDGTQPRSFCYADDLIDGVMSLMDSDKDLTGPINIGNPGEVTMVELAEKKLRMTQFKSKLVFMPLLQDDPRSRQPDIAEAQSKLGCPPRYRWKTVCAKPSPTPAKHSIPTEAHHRNHTMELKSIDTLHRTKTGKTSDKWASYLTYYDELFAPLRHKPISLLEIGVQNGGSQETWAEYFKEAQLFVGCDIDPKCEALRYNDPRIKIIVGDANAAPAFQKITALSTSFDIVIDDGSHTSHDILRSFINYFPLLKPGGTFVIEDSCCLYMDGYGGGLLNEQSAYAFFKRLIDVVNFQFWRNDISINNYLRTYFDLRSTPQFILDGWIDSIEFRNSIITIKKAVTPTHDKLGERIIVGTDAQVQTWGGKLPGAVA